MSQRIVKNLTNGIVAKEKQLNAINKVADTVGSTLGYRGRTVIIETDFGLPQVTKDGRDVLQAIFLEDPVEAAACELLKEAAEKTYKEAGDSTTATVVLAQAFIQNSIKALNEGKSSIDIKRETENSVAKIVEYLKSISIDITDELIYDVAKTSANGDEEIAKIIQKAFVDAGQYGDVSYERSNNDDTFVEYNEGTLVESGYKDEGFINKVDSQSVIFDNNPLILCSLNNFQTQKEIKPFMEYAVANQRPLVIISDMEYDLLNSVMINVRKGFPFAVVSPPSHGKKQKDTMNDLALILGCDVVSGLSGHIFEGKEELYLGTCSKIVITRNNTRIIPSLMVDSEPVKGKVAELVGLLKTDIGESEKKYIENRISKLSGGVSVIKVGGITPNEVEEKLARVDDAVCAVRSAKEEGVVAGGGTALYSCLNHFGDSIDGITYTSVSAPLKKILSNAGKDINVLGRQYPMGYDVKNYQEVNMFDAGIVNATKAERNALVNAVSASNNLLGSDYVITLKRIGDE